MKTDDRELSFHQRFQEREKERIIFENSMFAL